MAARPFILFVTPPGYRLGTPAGVVPVDGTADLAAALRGAGYAGGPIGVCVPSGWCLATTIDTADLPRNDARALAYRLEESLPLAAEAVIADFVSAGPSALGVCVRVDPLVGLVRSLEGAGVAVGPIVPTALAAAQQLAGGGSKLIVSAEAGGSEPQLNWVAVVDGRPTHWSVSAATYSDLKLQLGLLSAESGTLPPIESVGLDRSTVDAVSEIVGREVAGRDGDESVAAAALVAGVLGGRARPWVDFRRGPLAAADRLRAHRRWVDAVLAAGIAVAISVAAVSVARGYRYGKIARTEGDQTAADFGGQFPGWDVPGNVREVVDSEYRKAVAGAVPSAAGGGSAVSTLHDVLVPMASRGPMRVDRMAFRADSFEVSGRVDSAEAIDGLAAAARAAGMVVPPPQARREGDGPWSFLIQGNRPGKQGAGE